MHDCKSGSQNSAAGVRPSEQHYVYIRLSHWITTLLTSDACMHMKLLGSKEASILTLSSVHHFSSNSRQCYGTHVTLTRVARNNDEHSLGPRSKTNPSADRFQYRLRYTGSGIRARWGLVTRLWWNSKECAKWSMFPPRMHNFSTGPL